MLCRRLASTATAAAATRIFKGTCSRSARAVIASNSLADTVTDSSSTPLAAPAAAPSQCRPGTERRAVSVSSRWIAAPKRCSDSSAFAISRLCAVAIRVSAPVARETLTSLADESCRPRSASITPMAPPSSSRWCAWMSRPRTRPSAPVRTV
ncbi:Uncharacterised protein [Mycobacteroides abscessus subsp. massiliense]|nr:Uncharacterised protein [Mycobacteroides abscessus subsp. massiliense]